MLGAMKVLELLDRVRTYIMSIIPKMFNTTDVIDYNPAESSDDEEEEPIPVKEEWHVLKEDIKPKRGFWKRLFGPKNP